MIMNKKQIIEQAINFKQLIENEHNLEVDSLQAIVDIGLDYECGDQCGKGIAEIPEPLFVKGLTSLITAKILELKTLEVRWDEQTASPIVKNEGKITNIQEDLVKTFGEGRCAYNISWFFNDIMCEVKGFKGVESRLGAPLPLSAPGVSVGNFNQEVDNIFGRMHDFLDVIRENEICGEGSCVILSIEKFEEIGHRYEINVFDEYWRSKNDELGQLVHDVIDWFAGWVLYDENGFSLIEERFRFSDNSEIHLSDGYVKFNLTKSFQYLLKNRAEGNPFKVVKPLYDWMMNKKRNNRAKAWLFAANI